jgi:hypothetical protein
MAWSREWQDRENATKSELKSELVGAGLGKYWHGLFDQNESSVMYILETLSTSAGHCVGSDPDITPEMRRFAALVNRWFD